MTTREVPTTKTATLYRGDGKWCRSKAAAYYRIARKMVRERYEQTPESFSARWGESGYDSSNGEGYRAKERRMVIHRLARFLAFVDKRAAEQAAVRCPVCASLGMGACDTGA